MSTLQDQLLELGFLDVTGTKEWHGGGEHIIDIPHPDNWMRRDANNGVRVIVDDHGHYWIQPCGMHQGEETPQTKALMELHSKLQYGAYVPHSNDGGRFIRQTWPWLFNITPPEECVTIMVDGENGRREEMQILRKDYDPQLHGPAKTAPPKSHRL